MRWYKGQSVPFMNVFNPDSQVSTNVYVRVLYAYCGETLHSMNIGKAFYILLFEFIECYISVNWVTSSPKDKELGGDEGEGQHTSPSASPLYSNFYFLISPCLALPCLALPCLALPCVIIPVIDYSTCSIPRLILFTLLL